MDLYIIVMILGFCVSGSTAAVHTGDMGTWSKIFCSKNSLTCESDKHWTSTSYMYISPLIEFIYNSWNHSSVMYYVCVAYTQEAIKVWCATACLAKFLVLKPIQVSLLYQPIDRLISDKGQETSWYEKYGSKLLMKIK